MADNMKRRSPTGIRQAHARTPPRSGSQATKLGRPTSEELIERKERIVEVATELFLERGYPDTALTEIATRAGVTPRTIYQHFGDKIGLFEVVVDRGGTSRRLSPLEIDKNDTLLQAITRMSHYIRYVSISQNAISYLRLIVAESRRHTGVTRGLTNAASRNLMSNLVNAFEDLAARGMIAQADHQVSARILIDLILGSTLLMVFMDWRDGREDPNLEEKIQVFIAGHLLRTTDV